LFSYKIGDQVEKNNITMDHNLGILFDVVIVSHKFVRKEKMEEDFIGRHVWLLQHN